MIVLVNLRVDDDAVIDLGFTNEFRVALDRLRRSLIEGIL
jgi:hypothetical protein